MPSKVRSPRSILCAANPRVRHTEAALRLTILVLLLWTSRRRSSPRGLAEIDERGNWSLKDVDNVRSKSARVNSVNSASARFKNLLCLAHPPSTKSSRTLTRLSRPCDRLCAKRLSTMACLRVALLRTCLQVGDCRVQLPAAVVQLMILFLRLREWIGRTEVLPMPQASQAGELLAPELETVTKASSFKGLVSAAGFKVQYPATAARLAILFLL